MPAERVALREFSEKELLLDETQTRQVLKFLFEGFVAHEKIDNLTITNRARRFAQGLLVEAIDASYAMGYVEALFRATANPSSGVKKTLKKFGEKALKHWFKHASAKDLLDVEIYDIVRITLARNFKTELLLMINGLASAKKTFVALVDYDAMLGGRAV